MKKFDDIDESRRKILLQALTLGAASTLASQNALASLFGNRPAQLPSNQSIYRITGEATVNGKTANLQTRIFPGDTVATAKDSEIVFVVNSHSMILRANSQLVIETAPVNKTAALLISGLRLLTGKLLSVSRNSPMQINTATATIGIRGTGFYVESEPDLTYFCTCYGVTDVAANSDPVSRETVTSQHHDRPLYIVGGAGEGKNIRNAPFINHTDQELLLIETLVGRTTPFVFANDAYSAPRRDY
ncbi:MAG: FecR domain-containing protein [Gallionella sp.]